VTTLRHPVTDIVHLHVRPDALSGSSLASRYPAPLYGLGLVKMDDSQVVGTAGYPTPGRPTAVSRSRATSSSSVLTSASVNASPIRVAVVSSTSQPQLSQDYARANIKFHTGEAIPELQRTLSDLDIESRESADSRSESSRERTPRPRQAEEEMHGRPLDIIGQYQLASPSKRNPLGSRRSTISASAATTSVNLETADSITVTPTMDAISGLLSKSAASRATNGTDRKGKGPERRDEETKRSNGTRSPRKKRDKTAEVGASGTEGRTVDLERNGKTQTDDPWLHSGKNCMLESNYDMAIGNKLMVISWQPANL
jgi:hypothetical protein